MFWPVARYDDEGPKRLAAGGGAGPRAPFQVDDGLLEGLPRRVGGGDAVESVPDDLGRRILRDKQVGINFLYPEVWDKHGDNKMG